MCEILDVQKSSKAGGENARDQGESNTRKFSLLFQLCALSAHVSAHVPLSDESRTGGCLENFSAPGEISISDLWYDSIWLLYDSQRGDNNSIFNETFV